MNSFSLRSQPHQGSFLGLINFGSGLTVAKNHQKRQCSNGAARDCSKGGDGGDPTQTIDHLTHLASVAVEKNYRSNGLTIVRTGLGGVSKVGLRSLYNVNPAS